MKTRTKGKAIIGIAMAVIMLASVFAAMAPISARQDNTETNPGAIEQGDTVYRTAVSSERELDVSALIASGGTFYGITGSDAEGSQMTVADNEIFSVPVTAKLGLYNASGPEEGNTVDLSVQEATITGNVYINDFGDSIVGKNVPVGTPIQIRASPNFGGVLRQATGGDAGGYGVIKIKITPPKSTTREETFPASASDIDVTATEWAELDTTDWKTGTATVKITSVKGNCNDLDVSSAVYEFTVRSEKLSIEAIEDEVGKGEKIRLTVSGNPSSPYYFAIKNVKAGDEPKIEETAGITSTGPGEGTDAKRCAAWIKTSASGTREIEISTTGADERTYTMKVYDNPMKADGTSFGVVEFPKPADIKKSDEDADVKVKVVEAKVTFDIPTKVIIGEDLDITGAVSAGDKVDLIIKDEKVVEVNEPVDEDKEFSVEWETGGFTTGSYTIEAYIDFKLGEDKHDWVADNKLDKYVGDPDGKTTVRLIEPGITATQPRNVVAEEDDYTIEGTATGVDDVDYILIGPKGWRRDPTPSIIAGYYKGTASVTDNEFSEDETMEKDLDTGLWIALVLSPGRDGEYVTGDGAGNLDGTFGGKIEKGKNQAQIRDIIEDEITAAGSDDVMEMLSFKVESPYVRLNPIESVGVGELLEISGTTNREPDTSITISTFAGPTDLLALTEVEWLTATEGVFNATIDTTDAVEGTYTMEADDGDGHTDSVTVTIGPVAPTATPTAVPTAAPTAAPTAVPTPEPTAEPTAEPTPEPPGFEAVFAIAGMLAIAYLVVRKRRE